MLLDTATWDLVVNLQGNWAIAGDPYSQAQDAASACRLVEGELWFDTTAGIPYLSLASTSGVVLGQSPPPQVVKQLMIDQALSVPGVVTAVVFLTGPGVSRQLGGQIQITNDDGQTSAASVA